VWIFPGRSAPSPEPVTPRVFSKSVRRLLDKQLDIDPFTPHDLRRTMRTNLSKLKIPPHIAELCLNHSLGTIIDTYDQHSYLDERRDALKEWSTRVQVIIGKRSNVLELRHG
jgi:integrase